MKYTLAHSALHPPCVLLAAILLPALMACGGGDSAPEVLPDTNGQIVQNYAGPPAASEDVQQFKLNLWDNLVGNDRCGACHGTGGQSPMFVRTDDVNLAYAAANPLVDLARPQQSLLVSKVAGGHNCWLTSNAACADTLTRYIESWAGGSAATATRVVLEAPLLRDPGNSRSFPQDSTAFADSVYPVLRNWCVDCHVAGIQKPFLASDDVEVAYEGAQSKIDLDLPENSRLVQRLRDEFHNCPEGDCVIGTSVMQAAIEDFAASIPPARIDPELVTSKALSLTDGIVASSGGRFENHVIALYEFKTGEGLTAFDTSGVEPALNLTLEGQVDWLGGWGLRFTDGKAQGTTAASQKLHDLITATGEYSIEAWVVPANVTQEDAWISSYSGGNAARNFTLGQNLYQYDFLHRSSTTDDDGQPALSTAAEAERLQATQQHVVATFSPGAQRKLYVNGEYTGDLDPVAAGTLADWENSFALVLGNEVSSTRKWQGSLRLFALHNRALGEAEIRQNFETGVGEKFFLLFSVAHLIDVPESFVVFTVSQFDDYGYLFADPYFISLDPAAVPTDIPLEGMRIGINGREPGTGQSWANLALRLDASSYDPENGQPLSALGSVLPLERGPDQDEFFLTFERLGASTHVRVESTAPPADIPPDQPPVSQIGLRNFAEINASMAAMTGVSSRDPAIAGIYAALEQQLPAVEEITTFTSSQQMAVTQLAIRYCDRLIESDIQRNAFFGDLSFAGPPSTVYDVAGRTSYLAALLDGFTGRNLGTQAPDAAVIDEIDGLIDRLSNCSGACPADRSLTIAKAGCAALLGSATTLIQ